LTVPFIYPDPAVIDPTLRYVCSNATCIYFGMTSTEIVDAETGRTVGEKSKLSGSILICSNCAACLEAIRDHRW
jgi:hypothetical protein